MASGEGVIRRRILSARRSAAQAAAEGGPGADRAFRLSLARAARDQLGLALEVPELHLSRVSLAEVLEMPPEQALLALLDGPGQGIGLMALSPPVLAALIEVQTLGRVLPQDAPPRRPTRTDAAMVAGLVDAALSAVDEALADHEDRVWAAGFRYAGFLEEPRPLGLLLEDAAHMALRAHVVLAGGIRAGSVLLVLPADGRGARPARPSGPADPQAEGRAFAEALKTRVEGAAGVLDAAIDRISLPLSRILALQPGEVLVLPRAALDRISLEGIDGRRLAEGRLGQTRGMRAIRLAPSAGLGAEGPVATVVSGAFAPSPTAEPAAPVPLRAAG